MTPDAFTRWLHAQRDRDDPVGDLSRDQRRDSCWPRGRAQLDTLERHLTESHNSCAAALEALHRAWSEWEREGKAQKR